MNRFHLGNRTSFLDSDESSSGSDVNFSKKSLPKVAPKTTKTLSTVEKRVIPRKKKPPTVFNKKTTVDMKDSSSSDDLFGNSRPIQKPHSTSVNMLPVQTPSKSMKPQHDFSNRSNVSMNISNSNTKVSPVVKQEPVVVKQEYKSQRSPPQPVNPPKAKKPRLSVIDKQEIFKEHLQKLKAKLPVSNNNLPDIPNKQIFTRDMTKKIIEQRLYANVTNPTAQKVVITNDAADLLSVILEAKCAYLKKTLKDRGFHDFKNSGLRQDELKEALQELLNKFT